MSNPVPTGADPITTAIKPVEDRVAAVETGKQNRIAPVAANADTAGATLAALETEVNELKAALRTLGLMTA